MDGTLLKHKHKIIDLVNDKIEDIYHDVHTDGGEKVMDSTELMELHYCMEIMDSLGEIKHRHHDMKMDHADKSGNPYGNPHSPVAAGTTHVPHGHGYGTVQFTTMG